MSLPHKKNFLRDVLPKNSVEKPKRIRMREGDDGDEEVHYENVPNFEADYYQKTPKGRRWIWALATIGVLALVITFFYVFSSAEVVVVPRIDEVRFNHDFKAKKSVASSTEDSLVYSVEKIVTVGSKNVSSDGEKMQEKKASGKITIYNDYGPKEQRLIKNTRFETADGLIYRIDQSITIPPQKIVDGKKVPGTVEATVYADEPGTKYNIASATFTIPGFKSDPARFKGFHAKTNTAILGGFSGVAKYVTDARQQAVRAEIRSELEKQILAGAEKALSADYFIPKGAYTVEFESDMPVAVEGGAMSIKEKATVHVYSFNSKKFDAFLAKETPFASKIGNSSILIKNRPDLVLTWKTRPTAESAEISFNLKGLGRFVWMPDQVLLAHSLSGAKKSELQSILGGYNEVLNATASIAPFWSLKFPNNPEKIKIKIEVE
ncbi:MAG: hypothetical protein A3H57_03320 [Candidatus Taylorbacteria bacterium RIFCSPLOWO2_02_FULL_43_11]|uniref:Baseplate protein J-like domain-containing protein n=1 Tax=Candidatus Taylorbacteria bacterium RIFCSPHIGHO2_02_FULL_43_32b TaxID=1802306 RepID=A0A1G2MGF5_9BACT|nr:MAG: hypothetical protein A2743_02430 [Candidatus Taylorbacteria bacterium RIFCSPHIGHO2_01_FULL_43_47]OHA22249.1 MAG: hypothetical protein A3C72_04105 [Candidatus Taylorbacteria bacterium RIFCSPHIGHO2_02_FULL_43_32b]OHA29616.1 MAG: hypothetical protein A3B08_03290 [Candidatus Taylorbacteria bacterium RIFCSPLOWO2_01_FULL_43_44]OHA36134.1 MAG: hypothetical protein A3H57_03320 [Candidatus Taylorbacteria bacterium RIFCSPLOWO2_02_FULL_43_11]